VKVHDCPECCRWFRAEDDSLMVHALVVHPHSDLATAALLMRKPLRVPDEGGPRDGAQWARARREMRRRKRAEGKLEWGH
jgi:hypothetical protein